jgi:hypothetical protein
MDDFKEMKKELVSTANSAVGDIIYSVAFDVCNEIITKDTGADQAKVLEAANAVVARYIDDGVKVRKKPSPRPKSTKAPAKEKPVDALKAASRKMSSLADNIVWIVHPDSEDLSYTTSVKLATGYPVRDNTTNKVTSVATDDATVPLTVPDAKLALSYGLQVDYDCVED